MDVASFPIIVQEHIFSVLPDQQLTQLRLVCRQFDKLSKSEIERRILRRKDWRLDLLHARNLSPLKAWTHFQSSKNKHSTFTQHTILVGDTYDQPDNPVTVQMNEV